MKKLFIPYLLIYLPLFLVGMVKICKAAEITCNAMVADDGTTDNTAAFNACTAAAAAQTEKTVIIPAGDYYGFGSDTYSADVIIPDYVSVKGETGATVEVRMQIGNYSKIINLIFRSRSMAIVTPRGIWPAGPEGILVTGAWIQNCTFNQSGNASIGLSFVNDFVIDNNTFNNAGRRTQNINIHGGQRNIITNNEVEGGITGIILIPYAGTGTYSGSGGSAGTQLRHNIIMSNTVHGFEEEGITLDVEGSAAWTLAFKEYDTIASISVGTSQVTLNSSGWGGGDDPDYTGFDMIFLDGNLISQTREITGQSDATFTLDSSISGASAGNKVVIASTYKFNKIAFNRVYDSGFSNASILLYGLCFQNYVYENTIDDGSVSIRSLDSSKRPDTLGENQGNVTNTCGRLPCGYNYIHDNHMGSPQTNNGHMVFYYDLVGVCASGYSEYYTYGTTTIDNNIPSGIYFKNSSYYESGTTPSWFGQEVNTTRLTSIEDVTDRIDFSDPTCENQGLNCVTTAAIGHVTDLDSTCEGGKVCAAFGVDSEPTPPGPPVSLRIIEE